MIDALQGDQKSPRARADSDLVQKAYVYILRQGRLLVFRERAHKDSGVQVPGGTLDPGETPEQGARREVIEETGRTDLVIDGYLGSHLWNYQWRHVTGRYRRHFFFGHLEDPAPESWKHWEMTPSDGGDPFQMRFYWVPFPTGYPRLDHGYGLKLVQLRERLIAGSLKNDA